MTYFDIPGAIMQERAREAARINREAWKYEPLRLCLEAQRRMRFHQGRRSRGSTPDC